MKFKYTLIILFLTAYSNIFGQFLKTMYSYKGNGGDQAIYFWYDITLTFNTPIIGQLTSVIQPGANQGIFTENLKSDVIINNSQSITNRDIVTQSNLVTYSAYETPIDDYYQSNIFLDVAPGYNKNSLKLTVEYDNISTAVDLDNSLTVNYSSFPINRYLLPTTVLKYLNASPLVECTNTSIKNTAQSITSNCIDYRTAIIKLCQWIETNIKMSDTNPSNKSSDVYNNKIADCDGAAHLLAAFCRSLNIPARIATGYIIQHTSSYPINTGGTSSITLGSGNGTALVGHSVCEVYVPYRDNWVRCDPAQRTTLFGNQKFIKTATGIESTNHLNAGSSFSYYLNQPIKPTNQTLSINRCVFFGTKIENYKFIKSDVFPGSAATINNFGLLCAEDPNIAVGLNDYVNIQDPTIGTIGTTGQLPNNTYVMTSCSPANFYAKFVSESNPITYATSFDWCIVLYRSNGEEYIYSQQNELIPNAYNPNEFGEGSFWQPNLGVLPAYDWVRDPVGNIYGKVKVTVYINDGDTRYSETTISLSPNNIIQNTIYNADTTINACAELFLKNVSISGIPTITINGNGLNTTIDGTFDMPIGATLNVNP